MKTLTSYITLFLIALSLAAQEIPSAKVTAPPGYSQKWSEDALIAYQKMGERVSKVLRFHLPLPAKIILCQDHAALEAAVDHSLPDWTFGVALPHQFTLAINLKKVSLPSNTLNSVIRHETVHLYLGAWEQEHQRTLPLWFNEGVSEWFSGALHLTYQEDILNSIAFEKIIPFKNLEEKFPKEAGKAQQAYLQSLSMISYLVHRYGESVLYSILLQYQRSPDFEHALEQVLDTDLHGLQQDWYHFVSPGPWWIWIWRLENLISLFTIIALLVLIAYWIQRKRNQKLLKLWHEEELAQEALRQKAMESLELQSDQPQASPDSQAMGKIIQFPKRMD